MAITPLFEPKAGADAQYDSVINALKDQGIWPPEGLTYHVASGTGADFKVFEVWESEEHARNFLAALFGEQGIGLGGLGRHLHRVERMRSELHAVVVQNHLLDRIEARLLRRRVNDVDEEGLVGRGNGHRVGGSRVGHGSRRRLARDDWLRRRLFRRGKLVHRFPGNRQLGHTGRGATSAAAGSRQGIGDNRADREGRGDDQGLPHGIRTS